MNYNINFSTFAISVFCYSLASAWCIVNFSRDKVYAGSDISASQIVGYIAFGK